MIHVERAIAGAIPFASDVVELLEHLTELIKKLQPDDVFFLDLFFFLLCPGRSLAGLGGWRKLRFS